MQIYTKCPGCKFEARLDVAAADRRLRCPKCRLLFKVPALEEVDKALKIVETSQGQIFVDEQGNIYG